MTIKAVVFDIGGVLEINTPMLVIEKWEKQLSLSCGELNKRLGDVFEAGSIGTITEVEVRQRIGTILNLDKERVDNFMTDIWMEYLGSLNVQLTEYLDSLHSSYRTGIISNSFVGAREREEELYRFERMTDVIIYSHEIGISKPDIRIYELACEYLNVQPDETIFVDDYLPNVDAARAIGMHPVLFCNNAQVIEEIESILKS